LTTAILAVIFDKWNNNHNKIGKKNTHILKIERKISGVKQRDIVVIRTLSGGDSVLLTHAGSMK
jgi:hypothetical protein